MPGGEVGLDIEASLRSDGVNGKVVDKFMSTGAVVAGKATFEPAGSEVALKSRFRR